MAGLDDLEITRPCDASWEAMRGDDRARSCDRCRREVVDLSAHTRAEAEAIAAQDPATRPCLRITRDAAGRVLTSVGRRLPLVLIGSVAVASAGPVGLEVARCLTPRPAPIEAPASSPATPFCELLDSNHSGVIYYTARGSIALDTASCSIPTYVLGVGK
jgi:hypothetical protein